MNNYFIYLDHLNHLNHLYECGLICTLLILECEKDFNIFFHHVNLFLRGFNAAYILFLIELCMLY